MAEPRQHDELETAQLAGRPFALAALGMLTFLGISIGSLWATFCYNVPNRIPFPAQLPPKPRLLSHPPAELSKMLSQQRARLAGYHWVDRSKKLAAIPIGRAMTIVAARGADAYAPIPGAPSPPQPQIPQLLQDLTHPAPAQNKQPQSAQP